MTDKSTASVSAKCRCGCQIAWEDATADAEMLICKQCGTKLGAYGDLKRHAADAVRMSLEAEFKRIKSQSIKIRP
jgi:hypothetical protein